MFGLWPTLFEKQLLRCVMMMMMMMMMTILVLPNASRFIFAISISLHRLNLDFVFEELSQYFHFVASLVTAKIFVWVYRY